MPDQDLLKLTGKGSI